MINVAILGNGTVGNGVVELLNKNKEYIRSRTGRNIGISKILVRDIEKHIDKTDKFLLTNDIKDIYEAEPDIVVEAIGGLHPAYDYIKYFLKEKKHVVTANKEVIAKYGEELSEIACINGVSLRFEASVAGGIPILKPIQECLAGNNINYLAAILNGTTNFILSKMYSEGIKYEDALRKAQELGFAEANPDSDVLGYDSARKLAIISSITHDTKVNWKDINTEGIEHIDELDIKCARELGCNIKLVALSIKEGEDIYTAVKPVLVSESGVLGNIENEFNGILLEGDAVGKVFFSGKGAGKLPTASAVIGDIFDVLENKRANFKIKTDKKLGRINTWQWEADWLVTFKGEYTEGIIPELKNKFIGVELLNTDEDSEHGISVLLKSESEDELEEALRLIQENNNIKSIKKFMKLKV
ncbi:MAG: homoserine dehydrogenase [Solirubrobacterales bacterium]